MYTENVLASELHKGDFIIYRETDVEVVGAQEPDLNPFGLPWFRYRVRTTDGRFGYAKFGPTGHARRYLKTEEN